MTIVTCISIRETNPEQIKIGEKYQIDIARAHGDDEGNWYAPVYDMENRCIAVLLLSHFKSS